MHLVQISIDVPKALRFYRRLWPGRSPAFRDEGFLFKTVLTEVLGSTAPRPWRVQAWRPGGVLGYSRQPAEDLRDQARLALPELAAAVPARNIFSRPAHLPGKGKIVQLWATICPTVRQGSRRDDSHQERDAFLVEVEKATREERLPAPRLEVYAEYLRNRAASAGELTDIRATAWRLQEMARKGKAGQPTVSFRFPTATLVGQLKVTDALALERLIESGVGRARAYGYGMLLLKAA
jgi:CRISPR system Cascade subunit CasE